MENKRKIRDRFLQHKIKLCLFFYKTTKTRKVPSKKHIENITPFNKELVRSFISIF